MARIFDVVEAPDQGLNQMVYRVPNSGSGDFRLGSQVIVRENQVAVFFRDGKALDVFRPGRHTLTTNNIPLLGTLINLPFGGQTPFQAEVYFVNMKTFTGMKWGTPTPIVFRDSELHTVPLRAFGGYTLRVQDPQLFVNGVVGTEQHLERIDPVGVGGDRHDRDDTPTESTCSRVGSVVAHDHGRSLLVGLGAADWFEVDQADLTAPHQPCPSPVADSQSALSATGDGQG